MVWSFTSTVDGKIKRVPSDVKGSDDLSFGFPERGQALAKCISRPEPSARLRAWAVRCAYRVAVGHVGSPPTCGAAWGGRPGPAAGCRQGRNAFHDGEKPLRRERVRGPSTAPANRMKARRPLAALAFSNCSRTLGPWATIRSPRGWQDPVAAWVGPIDCTGRGPRPSPFFCFSAARRASNSQAAKARAAGKQKGGDAGTKRGATTPRRNVRQSSRLVFERLLTGDASPAPPNPGSSRGPKDSAAGRAGRGCRKSRC